MSPFFGFIIILFILAAVLRVDFFFTILYLFVGVYVVMRIWTEQILKGIVVSRTLLNRAFLGDTVIATITIKNNSRLPIPWLMFNEAVPWSLSTVDSLRQVISLSSGESFVFKYELYARRRGYYQVGPTIFNTGDLLGLNKQLMGRLEADYLIVYPKILPITELGLPTHSPQVILPTALPIFEDPARITGVRSYNWGDNPRHIHWPTTASTGQVMMKQFEPAIARESAIFLNMNRLDYYRQHREYAMELAIIVAASIAHHTLSYEKLPLGLNTVALDPLAKKKQLFSLFPHKQQAQLLQILEILARIQAIDGGDFLETIRQQAVHLSWGTTVIIITSQETETLLNTLLWLKQSGFNPTLILVGQHQRATATARLNIATYEVWKEEDIKTWSPTL